MVSLRQKEHFTLSQLREAGDMLLSQGKLDEADEMFSRAFETCRKKLGPDHPETLMAIFKLGICMERRKNFIEAEEKYKIVYDGRQKVLGADKETFFAALTIAELNKKLSRYHKAAEYYRLAYNGYLDCNGKNDPMTRRSKEALDEMVKKQSSTVCQIS